MTMRRCPFLKRKPALLAVFLVASLGPRLAGGTRSFKIRGVNLGGWLVLEKWIKPSLFEQWDPFDKDAPKDEWTYCQALGRDECQRRLEEHWDTWVTEDDIRELSRAGVTHLRVPVGYWIDGDVEGDEPYATGQWTYLARLCGWARQYRLTVWLDLHAAPGSQNGFDNSGRLGNATWDESMSNINRTLYAVEWLSTRVNDENLRDTVTGFGLLNEPDQHVNYWRMLEYYNHAYGVIRDNLGDGVAIYIGDMFNPQSFNWFWHDGNPIDATNVYLDSHIYACFVDDLKAMTPKQHITQVCRFERGHINQCCWDGLPPAPTELGRFVGEWTAAFDRTPSPELEQAYDAGRLKYVALSPDDDDYYSAASSSKENGGFGGGSKRTREKDDNDRDDAVHVNSFGLTPARKKFLRQYVIAQMATYEAMPEDSTPYLPVGARALDFHGWFFWNFKMEADVYREWDYLRGVREGWIPTLEPGLSIEEQFGLTCADLVAETTDCTDDVVDPFPPIPGWKGRPCSGSSSSSGGQSTSTGETPGAEQQPTETKRFSKLLTFTLILSIWALVALVLFLARFHRTSQTQCSTCRASPCDALAAATRCCCKQQHTTGYAPIGTATPPAAVASHLDDTTKPVTTVA